MEAKTIVGGVLAAAFLCGAVFSVSQCTARQAELGAQKMEACIRAGGTAMGTDTCVLPRAAQ